jgi:hypothetical protein
MISTGFFIFRISPVDRIGAEIGADLVIDLWKLDAIRRLDWIGYENERFS